jgi:hypothetical protein
VGVRKVRHHGFNIIGTFAGLKANSVPYESTIERDFMYFLEYDARVVSYESQPLFITGSTEDGKPHVYTPDFLVIRTTDRIIVECKPLAKVDEEETQQQCTLGRQWAEAHNHIFLLVTDQELRAGHRLNNLKVLWKYSRFPVPPATIKRCIAALTVYPEGMSFLDLATELSDGTSPPLMQSPALYALLFQHALVTNLSQPLSPTSLLFLPADPPTLLP